MNNLTPFLEEMENAEQRKRLVEIFTWIKQNYPQLETRIAWNQPMFTDHGTFIIAFSVAKKHISVAPEGEGITQFTSDFDRIGYSYGKQMFRIMDTQEVDYDLLKSIIDFNIEDKKDCTKFWRTNDK